MISSNEVRSLELALGEIENALNSGAVSPETVKTCGGREYDGVRKLTDKMLRIALKIQGNPPGGGGSGTTNHAALSNRNIADQHTIDAITGLGDALNEKANSNDLGTAAEKDIEYFANAAQGTKANTALQPTDLQDPASATASGKPADAFAAKTMVEGVAGDVEDIQALIPTQATSGNKLADKNFVNSTIVSLVADYIEASADGVVQFTSLAAVQAGPWYHGGQTITPEKNDYAIYANVTDGTWWTLFDGAVWANRFQINTTPMTAAQIAALNSNITAALTALIQTAVQQSRMVAGIALTADIPAAALKAALLVTWADIGGKPTTVSGFGITDAYTMSQVDTAIAAIVGAGFIPVAESTATKAGYKRMYLPDAHKIVIDMSPDQQISVVNRSETSNALARVLFKGVIYTIPAGGGTISTSVDGFTWIDGVTAPGSGNNARAFVMGGKIVLVSTNIDTAGVAGDAGKIFPAYESADGINWTASGVPKGTKALSTVCLTNTGRLIGCCSDGSESTISDDGAATWTAGTALPSTVIGSDTASYNFSCQIVNNPNFPTRVCFVANLIYPAANRGITRVAYSDDNGDSWTQGPNAPGSYKQGQCVHIKSNGTLICVNVVSNATQGRSVNGGASWTNTAGSGQTNTTNPQGLWIDDGTTWGIFLIKNGNSKTTRMTVNGGTSWTAGPDLPSTSGPYWQGPDNDSIFVNGATIKFLGGAATWLFSTEKVLLLDPPSDYINISDFKDLVSGAADWAAFRAAVAAL